MLFARLVVTAVFIGLFAPAVVCILRGDLGAAAVLYSAAWATIVALHVLSRALQVRQTLRNLRRLDPERRRAIVDNIRPFVARTYYDQQLRIDGEPEIGTTVERYPFSPRERREQELLYWAITLIAAVVLLAQTLIAHVATWERLACGAVVAACVAALWFLRRRSRHLETVIEVSPFGLVEIHPDGQRRHLRFGIALQLRVNRRRSRAELAAVMAPNDIIALDFDRLGFNRLLERVIDWGGFRPATPQPIAPPRLPDPNRAVIVPAPPPWSMQSLASLARAAVRSWPTALAVGVALWVVRPAPRVTHFYPLTVAPTAISPVRMTYISTHYGSYWVGDPDSLVLTIRACGSAWCLTDDGDSLRLQQTDLRPLAALTRGIGITWRNDSVHAEYNGADRTYRFDTRARPGALPNSRVLDLLIARAGIRAGPGAVLALQAIEPDPDDMIDGFFVGDRIRGEGGEIKRLLRSDTVVVEVAGRIGTPYRGTKLVIHYPDRLVCLWVMDSTHYIVRREAQFRDHLVGTWVDSLVRTE